MEVGEPAYVVPSTNLRMPKARGAHLVSAAEVHLLVQIVQGTVVQVDAAVEGVAQEEDAGDVLLRKFTIRGGKYIK